MSYGSRSRKAAFEMNSKYHIQKSRLICPYCNEQQEDVEDLGLEFFVPEIINCYWCNKKFSAEQEVCFTTYAVCKENNMEHDFYETHIKNFFMCENCEHSKHGPLSITSVEKAI